MTPTEQAARWLADVRRYDRNGRHMELDPQGPWLHEAEVLAAIARHIAPGDDLVERLLAPCQNEHTYDADKEEAAERISILTDRKAKDSKAHEKEIAVWSENYAAKERENATLRDRLARMEDAATKIRGLIKYDLNPKSCEITASEDGEFVVYDHVSAALTALSAERGALAAQVAVLMEDRERLGREVNLARYGHPDFAWRVHTAAMTELQAKVARMEGALRPFCFYNEDEPESDVQHAWEIRYQDRFKDWIDFGDIVAARAALTESPADGGKDE